MRLTAEAILKAPNYLNPCGDREVSLRGLQAPSIENLALLQDQYESIDLSFNQLERVSNFPLLSRLTSLNLSHNRISAISSVSLVKNLPNLQTLLLHQNNLKSFSDVYILKNIKKLELLSLSDNRIQLLPHYKRVIFHWLPQLKFLDYNKIKQSEREDAEKFFETKEGKDFLSSISAEISLKEEEKKKKQQQQQQQAVAEPTKEESASAIKKLTPQEKKVVKLAIQAAKTKEEVERIEQQLRAGTFDFSSKVEERESEEEPHKKKAKTETYDIDVID